ncbi:tyrosine-type recombinase/integrase [Acidithiobacillus ferriphilus]|uniref:tyrosine-type recombinase/integrase n=1 Tax=Acidithiobacillus ferriphilus TaxID=1689834 RepID=UPI002DC05B8D|nr:tyrosine-type recombinase/integrase [Acidithiobacillus ferriphilus]MEB8474553.1 tyrosine-type recombinase/integrase [Acidithiobacillus ferriphilus]
MIDIEGLTDSYTKWLGGPNFRNPYSAATIRLYGVTVRRFLEFLDFDGAMEIIEVNIHLVRKYVMSDMKNEIAPKNTQTVRTSSLVLFFDYLESVGENVVNPARAFMDDQKRKSGGRGGRSASRLKTVLEWDEIDRLRFEAGRSETIAGIRDAALIGLILDTGLRASEVCGLTIADGDGYLARRLKVIGKGDKERLVRFEPHHAPRMRSWLRTRRRLTTRDDRLFVTDQGNGLTIAMLYMIVSRLLHRAGIHKAQRGPHLLRHTAASMWLANGVELKQVQENLGHSNIGTTSRYLHLLGSPNP